MKDIKLEFESEYNDSYNLKYKRNQLNNQIQDIYAKNSIFYNSNNYILKHSKVSLIDYIKNIIEKLSYFLK